ncbi:ubiquinone-binding COQ10-like protein [Aspergillus nidulans FGSC A4]|uniref:Sreptomyces cyclase/dehydrase family protein (AFU_orthologue AFUA_6G07220) n=1 Tax=Emericella nidulans (strain FGSC A4 / ATCC 38163 / CBS 112.46 / NRRL 194 / M139) TaxID=227321 RepID=C8VF14_EMENI|nr:hypothetical protein [Aspergillus nidulans FGSC A4]CBF80957.1 TPA: sreptomyces cyclase/dehydrase family protein (AFU_orthologue; AFUA_6G07220) [Aspergillus nidulans FGSC A4]
MNHLLAPRSIFYLNSKVPTIRPEILRCRLFCYTSRLQGLPQQPSYRQSYNPQFQSRIEKRTFLSSFIPSPPQASNNGDGNGNNKARILTASRTLPYPPSPLFNVISSVESYAEFLPFLTASTVTARDPETRYPTQAYLTVGYGPLSETFTSKVDCNRESWVVEARSGERFGIFEYLSTRWELVPETASEGGDARTTVNLEIRFEFKSQLYASMMSAVEGQMAGIMIEAFEKRIREVHGR